MLRWRFIAERDPSSRLIAWFGGGDYSHVDTILPDGTYLGARHDKLGGMPAGVQIRPANYIVPANFLILELAVTAQQECDYYGFLTEQIGKPYDTLAIFGFLTGRNWAQPGAWECAELSTAAATSAKIFQPPYLTANRITPNDFTLMLSIIGGTDPSAAH
jgi:hypothetical protein